MQPFYAQATPNWNNHHAPYGLTQLTGLVYGQINFDTARFKFSDNPNFFGLQGLPIGGLVLGGDGPNRLFLTDIAIGGVDLQTQIVTNTGVFTITGGEVADRGRIVNISTVGTINSVPAGASVYTGTKAAVEQFTMALARELGGRGITVNTVSPGVTETEGFRKNAPPEMQILAAKMSPLGRIGQPQDIADVVAFLVSDQARWLTGQNIRACGGAA